MNAPDFRYGQKPFTPDGNWSFSISDEEYGPYIVYDNYNFTSGAIQRVDFWGLDLYSGTWSECEENPTSFHVNFYVDAGGQPDYNNPTYTFDVTTYNQVPSGQVFSDIYIENFYQLQLPSSVAQTSGWISIQGIGDGNACVFRWSRSPEGDQLSYRFHSGVLTPVSKDQAFCLYGEEILECLTCNMTILSPNVPSIDGTILFDISVTNCGNWTPPVFAEIYPTIGDCVTGTAIDFNINRMMTANLNVGETYVGQYFYAPGDVSGMGLSSVALNVDVGPAIDDWYANCCDEFFFYNPWGRISSPNVKLNMEFFERNDMNANLPVVTALGQNYPNPFNATTAIPFDLAESGNVVIKIYNLSGQLVETLVDGYMDAGSHYVLWDASKYPSGIYFYKLWQNDFSLTKMMNLLK